MKRNIFSSLMTIVIVGLFTLGLSSCGPKCERENFGTVIVTNNTYTAIYVDCTYEGSSYNDERYLGIGGSTTYQFATPELVTEWATPAADYAAGNNWYMDQYYLQTCETHDDPWTSYKKSTKISLEKDSTKVFLSSKIK